MLALLDEFGLMPAVPQLKHGMSFLRAYHIRPIIMVQYLAQIRAQYGADDAYGFLNTKVKIAFALNDIDDANYFSKAMGTTTITTKTHSTSLGYTDHSGSNSNTTSYQAISLMRPDEVMKLKKNDAIILMESQLPMKVKKGYWFKE